MPCAPLGSADDRRIGSLSILDLIGSPQPACCRSNTTGQTWVDDFARGGTRDNG